MTLLGDRHQKTLLVFGEPGRNISSIMRCLLTENTKYTSRVKLYHLRTVAIVR